MRVDLSVLLIILGCALVTFAPRILPFVVVRKLNLPQAFMKWLSYIPVCLLTALVVQEMIQKTESIPMVNWLNIAMVIPTLLTALKTKSLLATVLVGIVSAGLLRWIF
ncbi:Branched-chain amino acid transport protein [Paenibacillus sp. yr247]|uniref:AzlD domain-containing protein n=1 Tax=Paenibacillus sp. yr247 TaxID=1761880 RepID=UPI000880DE55|nr:AzlD domain-containing protein [Paenibacillus sp. yr247]SDN67166.1 Branched-chain amino acid transport protein [Paenibacillus sp. yr247]